MEYCISICIRCLTTLVLITLGFACSCEGYVFTVGGKEGWVPNPAEDYTRWAQRNRFQVNDTLLFKYSQGKDSVLVVTRDDYSSCNTKNPIASLADGNSLFTFDRSGPFFFISGNPGSCNAGQKLLIIVLAVRERAPSPSPAREIPSPPPAQVLPPQSPVVPSDPGSNLAPSDSGLGIQAPAPAPSSASSIGAAIGVTISAIFMSMMI